MARITVELPESLRSQLEARAAQAGHGSVEEHVTALIRADLESVEDVDFGAPEHLKVRSAADLNAKLVEGMNSPASEMTSADWEAMRRRLIERHAGGQSR